MKRFTFCAASLFIFIATMQAQQNSLSGSYYLEGVREMASVFTLKPDSSFEFFFSYGALDRYGTGKWALHENKIVLNSKPYPGKDFKLVTSRLTKDNFITIKIEEKNTQLFSFIYAFTNQLKPGSYPVKSNADGIIQLPLPADTLHLLFEFTPERMSSFPINSKAANNFTFSFEKWAMDVFLKDFELTVVNNQLEGKHPLLEKENCVYKKQ